MTVAISDNDHNVIESILVETRPIKASHNFSLNGLEEFTEVGGASES